MAASTSLNIYAAALEYRLFAFASACHPWAYLLTLDTHDSGWGWGSIGAVLIAEFGATTFGLVAGIFALVRRERWLAVTSIAILVNLYPAFEFLFVYLTSQPAPHP